MKTRALGLALLLEAALVAPGAAHAKGGVCVHTTALGGWTFVLGKVSLKPGASGALSGYAVADNGTSFEPISGSFMMAPAAPPFLDLGITRYDVEVTTNTGISFSHSSTFHQMLVATDGSVETVSDATWTREDNGTSTNADGDTQLVDCATVPTIPTH